MKRFIVGLSAFAAMFVGLRIYAGVPGQELIPPTSLSHIYQDYNGNMTFSDANAGPTTLSQISGLNGLTVPSGSIQFGSATTAISTATASLGQGTVYTAFLASGTTAAVQGSLLIATTTQNNLITVQVAPAVSGLTNTVGIAATAASTGTIVNVYSSGWILALTTGTVNPGDVLVSTISAAGYLASNNSALINTGVAIALQTGNSAGGLIKVKITK